MGAAGGFDMGPKSLNKALRAAYGDSLGSITKTVQGHKFADKGVIGGARYHRADADFNTTECKEAVRGASHPSPPRDFLFPRL